MTKQGKPFKIIGNMICWIKRTLTVIFIDKPESEE